MKWDFNEIVHIKIISHQGDFRWHDVASQLMDGPWYCDHKSVIRFLAMHKSQHRTYLLHSLFHKILNRRRNISDYRVASGIKCKVNGFERQRESMECNPHPKLNVYGGKLIAFSDGNQSRNMELVKGEFHIAIRFIKPSTTLSGSGFYLLLHCTFSTVYSISVWHYNSTLLSWYAVRCCLHTILSTKSPSRKDARPFFIHQFKWKKFHLLKSRIENRRFCCIHNKWQQHENFPNWTHWENWTTKYSMQRRDTQQQQRKNINRQILNRRYLQKRIWTEICYAFMMIKLKMV